MEEQLSDPNTFREREQYMTRSKKIMIGAGSILLVLALAGGLWLMSSPTLVTFAQAPTPTTPATPGTWQAYQEAFLNALATRLGTTIDQLKQAYQGAFNDTVDQAVTDGNLTQDQATQMKDKTGQMLDQGVLPGFAPFGPNGGRGGHGFKGEGVFGMRGGFELNTFAQALNMTQADLMTELQSGKTLAQIVTEKNGDLNQIKTTVLENLKTKLDQAVADSNLTQAQADEMYNQASTNFDTMVNQTWQGKPWGERMMPENPTQNQDFPNWNAPVNPNWQNQ